ncbi:hypothetical protein NDU88_003073 [Pleurodeles waltl]|uniref:Uncharacterized protein n=1 Tax=Pleurodeles waltl TaxID=8319 RepID=A0AAV7RDY9_PLEWA|nr:hypothetical protein NDU88_003073 [Pleurodeles waltl]
MVVCSAISHLTQHQGDQLQGQGAERRTEGGAGKSVAILGSRRLDRGRTREVPEGQKMTVKKLRDPITGRCFPALHARWAAGALTSLLYSIVAERSLPSQTHDLAAAALLQNPQEASHGLL